MAIKLGLAIGFGVTVIVAIAAILITFGSPEEVSRIPDPGVYLLPDSEVSKIPPLDGGGGSFDLTLAGGRYNSFIIRDNHIGPPDGSVKVIEVLGDTGDIYVQAMTADGLECPTFQFSDTEIHTATFQNNVSDGQDFSLSGGTPSLVTIASQRGGKDYILDLNTYDKIKIVASADVDIGALVIENVKAVGGTCTFAGMKIGTLNVINSLIGTGDGTSVKEFGFSSGVVVGDFSQSINTETEVNVR